ncbi:helix-turn-helix transcriptional regulator [Streptomyces sp. HNM0575]|uniref:helix-turn-helix transcriptional regulator n=1 Tax=Streptomyces sp. HNM0575 TaxID=2716338 RepID=UPI00145E841B|nr:AraC family transcriptional regulator [Streptomyces sp. HNM0575]NLU74993.1 helix-turn-helix transcriptional regulator [Streptomyces sp. HNM0575]
MTTANRRTPTDGPDGPDGPNGPDGGTSPILSIERGEVDAHTRIEPHSHPEPMLLWTATATVTVSTTERDWLVPPAYGMWIPAGTEHTGATQQAGEGCIIRFAPAHCPIAWTEPTGLAVTPLLRELILHLARNGPTAPGRGHAEALVFDLLTPLPSSTIHVTMPADPRVRTIAERLVASPADPRELAGWAHEVHAGVRTLSRLFLSETGLTFAQWRTRVRIRAAAHLLADGESVGATARAVGYRKTGAFINAFRRATGQTPGAYTRVDTVPLAAPAPTRRRAARESRDGR